MDTEYSQSSKVVELVRAIDVDNWCYVLDDTEYVSIIGKSYDKDTFKILSVIYDALVDRAYDVKNITNGLIVYL